MGRGRRYRPGPGPPKGLRCPWLPCSGTSNPLSAFAVVAAKNLFSQDRTGPTLGPAKVQNSLEGRQLLGTLIIGDTRAALIGGKTGPPGGGERK